MRLCGGGAHASASRRSASCCARFCPTWCRRCIALLSLEMGIAVIVEAILSFVGLSVSSDTPTWGGMIAEGRQIVHQAWWSWRRRSPRCSRPSRLQPARRRPAHARSIRCCADDRRRSRHRKLSAVSTCATATADAARASRSRSAPARCTGWSAKAAPANRPSPRRMLGVLPSHGAGSPAGAIRFRGRDLLRLSPSASCARCSAATSR